MHALIVSEYRTQELIRIPGYTFEEKFHIAERYLVPKQVRVIGTTQRCRGPHPLHEIQAHGLDPNVVTFHADALMKVAVGYTREAGVRNLEREIASICRSLAVEFANQREDSRVGPVSGSVDVERVSKALGPEKFDDEVAERTNVAGVAVGLAWTSTGAGGLLFIEATQMTGKGVLHLTGKSAHLLTIS